MIKRKIICLFAILILGISFLSAEIILQQQPEGSYNMGDVVTVPIKITTLTGINEFLNLDLLCNGQEKNVHKEYVVLESGNERKVTATIPLIKSFTTRTTGHCKVKASLGEEFILTNQFKILDTIAVKILSSKKEFSPNEGITIEGEALKQNQDLVQGFVDIILTTGNESGSGVSITDTVNNGYFFTNFTLPSDTKSGQYLAKINVYEKDSEDQITNSGGVDYYISISQIPTNLEILFEEQEVLPGSSVKIKPILRDQAGDKIPSVASLTIKNKQGDILKQKEQTCDEFLEFSIKEGQKPTEFLVEGVSNQLSVQAEFFVKEDARVETELVNNTLTIKNVGNVLYNKTFLVKIGEKSVSLNLSLDIGEETKFFLSAPDGEYEVEVISDGEKQISEMVLLTGKAVDVKKIRGGAFALVKSPFAWIFVIIILGIVAYIVYKKGYKRSFFGHMPKADWFKKKFAKSEKKKSEKNNFSNLKNRAELSLSIKGNKQPASVVCLRLKGEVKKNSGIEETLGKISDKAEEDKAVVYKNRENVFFIFSPVKTKTFKNEIAAIKFSQEIQKILREHNKKFKETIEYGISINYGNIIAKKDGDVLKFMSLGTLISQSKKLAGISKKEVLLSEKINSRIQRQVKTQKQSRDGTKVYVVREIKDTLANAKFLNNFLKSLEKDKK